LDKPQSRWFWGGFGKVEKKAGENAGVAVAPLHGSPRPAMPVASGFFGLQGQKTKRGC
jgi:hypothetical protein